MLTAYVLRFEAEMDAPPRGSPLLRRRADRASHGAAAALGGYDPEAGPVAERGGRRRNREERGITESLCEPRTPRLLLSDPNPAGEHTSELR